ncbi:ankyrin repeat and LEM domain-containing protein 1 isoform X1 [Mus musculus]|uniref:ankyrin repeat and LEM domain-containing protein 1 isoform X1 n=1 Tax=Mus musculus TaxID=10090 RepID=UPI0003D75522|nr:ankyrin repeat and LEM domain-containing protein 1 isoform X1 [Mus musculus]|eukprot:XP_006509724.1 PREDICTED: ankyrin repeat and LEM domain-containing protein 1 isoform X1 [Mus musculus]
MADTACLALRLLAALREEEARAVEELLRLGADPNLVLDDGAAAVHLAARASHPRALHCLRMLLRWGADPNARSAEGLTPVHVAAAWGCCGALELLLSRGGDPTLRDQDGLRPLDWALQQRHHNCARVLQELDTPTQPDETREPTESSGVSQDSELHVHRAELEVEAVEVAVHPQSSEATENSDYSSDASFVTAVEDSLQPGRPGGALELVAGLWVTRGAVSAGKGAPNCQPQVLTLTARDTDKPVLPGDGDLGALHPHSSVPPMSDLQLLQALRALGYSPGPVTPFTRGHYLRRLQEAQASRADVGHSQELAEALRTGTIPDCQVDEEALAQCFQRLDPLKKWREGITKSSFTYLLLDPRLTKDLPARASSLTLAECLQCFVRAIFYVGKGTRARPDAHLWEAFGYHDQPRKQVCPKVRRILDIWASGRGIISLHCFQHVVAMEAYTREACLLDALGLQTLTNQKQGHYYGVVAHWPPSRRRRLGVHLLQRALLVFLAEGERELRPQDIQARG